MISTLLLALLSLCFPFVSEQTEIMFDDPLIQHSSPYYARQICTDVRTETCCQPLDLQIETFAHTGWFHARRVTYSDLPFMKSWESPSHYLAIFTYDNGQAACRGKAVDVVDLTYQKIWRSAYEIYPYLTGGAFLSKSEPVAFVYNVYPDVVTYQNINYTDSNRGDGVYTSKAGGSIYGKPLFSTSSRGNLKSNQ